MINTSIVYYGSVPKETIYHFVVEMVATDYEAAGIEPPKHAKFPNLFVVSEKEASHEFWLGGTNWLAAQRFPIRHFRFDITFLKDKAFFHTPDKYFCYYIQCLVRNELVNEFGLRLVDHNPANKMIPTDITFKNYKNFLGYLFKGKQKQAARRHYLQELKTLPPSAKNMEGGIKTFL